MDLGVKVSKLILAFMMSVNPLGALSIYPDSTRNHNMKERCKITSVATLTVFIVITIFVLTGGSLLRFLGISAGLFQASGGILILLIATSMMNSNSNPIKPGLGTSEEVEIIIQQPKNDQNIDAIAVVPIAIPVMIGPGGVSTVIIYTSVAKSHWGIISTIVVSLLISLIRYAVLTASPHTNHFLGGTGLTILNRIMGMLLAAISVEIIVAGPETIFP